MKVISWKVQVWDFIMKILEKLLELKWNKENTREKKERALYVIYTREIFFSKEKKKIHFYIL